MIHILKDKIFGKFKYILYTPSENTENLPLIVVLHGLGEVGKKLSKLKTREPYLSFKKKFNINAVVLMPQLPSGSWRKSATSLKKLIDYVAIENKCDTSHISITGHSLGGAGVLEMIIRYPNYFSACAPLSPCVNYKKEDLKKIIHIPIWFFYGEKEGKIGKYTRSMKTKLDNLKGNVKLTCVKGKGHAIQFCWIDSKYKLFNWLINFRRII